MKSVGENDGQQTWQNERHRYAPKSIMKYIKSVYYI